MQARGTGAVGDEAVLVDPEGTGTGVGQRAAVVEHEEPRTLDGHVQHVAGVAHVPLAELLGNVAQAHAIANALAAGTQLGRRVDVFEFRTRGFETGGADVGDVVAGNVQLLVGCREAAEADVKTHIPLLVPR
ncbi:hypothetical protein D3C84_658110 [compost metagenome]